MINSLLLDITPTAQNCMQPLCHIFEEKNFDITNIVLCETFSTTSTILKVYSRTILEIIAFDSTAACENPALTLLKSKIILYETSYFAVIQHDDTPNGGDFEQ